MKKERRANGGARDGRRMLVFSLPSPRKTTESKGPLKVQIFQTLRGRDPNWEGTHERLSMRLPCTCTLYTAVDGSAIILV